jgi:hypothetical protein
MADLRRAWLHLTRGLEELLRGAAELAAAARERAEGEGTDAPAAEAGAAHAVGDLFDALTSGPGGGLDALRVALEREVGRWEEMAADDPAARRVRDVFAGLLAVLEAEPVRSARPLPRRAPGRGRGRTPRASPRTD